MKKQLLALVAVLTMVGNVGALVYDCAKAEQYIKQQEKVKETAMNSATALQAQANIERTKKIMADNSCYNLNQPTYKSTE